MAHAKPTSSPGIFEIQQQDDTLIVSPVANLTELDYQQIEGGAKGILDRLNEPAIMNVVLDFSRTEYFGSTALGFFVKIWHRVRRRNGRMAFCNVSDNEKKILQITNLDQLWPICSTRAEALATLTE